MEITSPEFQHKGNIPKKFTCQGEDVNPSLVISGVPEGARSLILIVDDPDAPGRAWVHWVVFNIAADVVEIDENSVPGKEGLNDFGRASYGGPCPPSGTHRYFFKLYALDTELDLPENVTKKRLEEEMKGHILEQAELIGLYKKE